MWRVPTIVALLSCLGWQSETGDGADETLQNVLEFRDFQGDKSLPGLNVRPWREQEKETVREAVRFLKERAGGLFERAAVAGPVALYRVEEAPQGTRPSMPPIRVLANARALVFGDQFFAVPSPSAVGSDSLCGALYRELVVLVEPSSRESGSKDAFPLGAVAFLTNRPPDEVIFHYSRVLEWMSPTDPRRGQALMERSKAKVRRRDLEGAIADLTALIELDPKSATGYCARAQVQSELGSHEKAEADFAEAIRLDPGNKSTYYERGIAREKRRAYPEASSDFDRVIGIDARDLHARLHRAACREAMGDLFGALDDVDLAMKPFPFPPMEMLQCRARLYTRIGEGAKAVTDAERLCKMSNRKNAEHLATLAAAYAARGDFATAVQWETQALELGQPGFDKQASQTRLQQYQAGKSPIADTCIVQLTTVARATVVIDGRDYGAAQTIRFEQLQPGRKYVSQLRVLFPDGGEARRTLAIRAGRVVSAAATAPSRIAFVRHSRQGKEVCVIAPDGAEAKRLVADNFYRPVLSPDGSKIALLRAPEEEDTPPSSDWGTQRPVRLWILRADGGEPKKLPVWVYSGGTPAWSPDGTRLLCCDPQGIQRIDLDGNVTRVTVGSAPAWSPDGRKIAFHATDTDARVATSVYRMNADATGLQRLAVGADGPQWSPDGDRLLFHRYKEKRFSRWVINVDGSGERHLMDDAFFPRWSPDGEQIVFCRRSVPEKEGEDLYVIGSDGNGLRQITHMAAGNWSKEAVEYESAAWPCWSPDGTQIAFLAQKKRIELDPLAPFSLPMVISSHLCLINADGSGMRRLVAYDGVVDEPDWR